MFTFVLAFDISLSFNLVILHGMWLVAGLRPLPIDSFTLEKILTQLNSYACFWFQWSTFEAHLDRFFFRTKPWHADSKIDRQILLWDVVWYLFGKTRKKWSIWFLLHLEDLIYWRPVFVHFMLKRFECVFLKSQS